ncbi:hypothetical protein ZWY2020_032411 [Hordeum vulgare]|nr:hypothetical protein ZWY2020_032411 [Hordeum vulgare]
MARRGHPPVTSSSPSSADRLELPLLRRDGWAPPALNHLELLPCRCRCKERGAPAIHHLPDTPIPPSSFARRDSPLWELAAAANLSCTTYLAEVLSRQLFLRNILSMQSIRTRGWPT